MRENPISSGKLKEGAYSFYAITQNIKAIELLFFTNVDK